MATQQQYDQLIASFEDAGGNTSKELRTTLSAFRDDILGLKNGGAAQVPLFGSGVPASTLGSNGQTYTNTVNGYVYQKQNGSWVYQYVAKGKDGSTPRAGIDYQQPSAGADGEDGNRIHDKNYAPRPSDNVSVGGQANLEGDQWFYTISLASYERYAFIGGQWTLVFRKAESAAPATPASDTQAPNLTFSAPSSGATVTPGQQLTLTALATDNVAVTQVLFLNGSTGGVIGTANKNGNSYTLPYTVPSAAGPLTLQAQASDAAGNSQVASVTITVQAPAQNQLPTANAGADTTITLPTNQVALMGSGSDSDGTVTGYSWVQITGPNNASGLPASSQNVVVSNLVQGIYQFRLTVTDNSGGQRTDDVVVTVNAAAQTTYTATQQSYTTTAGDYQSKCGKAYSGTYNGITRTNSSETSTANQADANTKALAAAKADAIGAIVCQVSYNMTLTGPSDTEPSGVTWTTDGGAYKLQYNVIQNGDSTAKRMDVYIGGTQRGLVDFGAAYLGQGFYVLFNNTLYAGTFTDGTVNLTAS